MARWSELEAWEPELAALARRYLDLGTHKTIATLRADGSPRISGTEVPEIDGDLWLGSMPNSMKSRDLRRDGRYALHSHSIDPPDWEGDAKLAGVAFESEDARIKEAMRADGEPAGDFDLFRLEIAELAVVRLNDARDGIIVETWIEGRGVKRLERS
ncbi:pyridoxamine 5'-phosphate oxidase [Thermoleophilia bacterium SCSIO 60948]|nr:pyridoxamine 5'-phosphate oxidase [Thermoleophilia bacterium SCSIO 60948]